MSKSNPDWGDEIRTERAMSDRDAAIRRWLGQIYNSRGQLNDATWQKFKAFYAELGWWDDVAPGVRLDGRDQWDVFEEELCASNREPRDE